MQEDEFQILDVAGLIRRRARIIGLTFLTITLTSLVVAFSLTNLYRGSGTIMIERPEVSDAFRPGTYETEDHEQRIARINDEVMTRTNLTEIVERHDLYRDLRVDGLATSVVPELRSNFELDLFYADTDPRNKNLGAVTGFRLSYYHADPMVARDVSRDIVNLFQEGNRQRRQQDYMEVAAALGREADNLEKQVAEAENELANFKSRHPGALPEDRNYNRQIIERKARDLDGLDREIRSLQERKTLHQSQLAQTSPWVSAIGPNGEVVTGSGDTLAELQSEYLRQLGTKSPDHPTMRELRRQIQAFSGGGTNPALRQAAEVELTTKRQELDLLKQQSMPGNPDLRALERSIAALEQQLMLMPEDSTVETTPNNPTYVNLQLQLDGVNNELNALRFDREQLKAEISILEDRVQVAPEVERDYLDLTRDLGLARKQYEDIKTRQMTVQRAGILEEEELSERYVITSYPGLSYIPSFPNRPLIIAVGLFLAVTLGLALGIGSEALDGTIRSTKDVQRVLHMPPVAAIPVIATATDLAAARRSKVLAIVGITSVVVAVAIYVQLQRTGAL